jgi:hypothetical protein
MTTLPQTFGRATGTVLLALVAASLLLSSCGSGSSPTTAPTPAPEIKTETFSGSIAQGGSALHAFTVVAQGTITATLTSLSPQSTVTMGFGIGTPSGTTCALITGAYSEAAKVGYALSGTIATGSYCVLIYDIGNLSAANDYVITVAHP